MRWQVFELYSLKEVGGDKDHGADCSNVEGFELGEKKETIPSIWMEWKGGEAQCTILRSFGVHMWNRTISREVLEIQPSLFTAVTDEMLMSDRKLKYSNFFT
ncbi:hypothetical protein DINM_006352 [Dirofilaria immitis]|nr:hypothetical protein [Dirofilaria immitis]